MRLTGAKGFLIGVGGLAAAQLFLSSDRGTKTYGAIVTMPSDWLAKWFDPTQPLIADHRTGSGSAGGSDPCAGMSGATLQLCRQGGGKAGGQDCSKLFGYAKDFCVAGQTSASPPGPTTTQIPTTSAASALQV